MKLRPVAGQRDANCDFISSGQWAGAAFAFLISLKCHSFPRRSGLSWIGYQFLEYLKGRY